MKLVLKAAAVAGILITGSFTSASAQAVSGLNISSISQRCAASPQTCSALLLRALAELRARGASPAQINEAIAALSAVAVDTANANPSSVVRSSIANTMSQMASQSTDPRQAAALSNVGQNIAAGRANVALPGGVAASLN